MSKEHHHKAQIQWAGNLGQGTSGYQSYSRDHEISIEGKPPTHGDVAATAYRALGIDHHKE